MTNEVYNIYNTKQFFFPLCFKYYRSSKNNKTIGIEINFQEKKTTARLSTRLIIVLIICRLSKNIKKCYINN